MQSSRRTRRASWCGLIALAALTQCQTMDSSATTDGARQSFRPAACAAFAPVYWSAKDTAKTIAQVKEHNAAWQALCRKAGS
jgi:hypothetical protein